MKSYAMDIILLWCFFCSEKLSEQKIKSLPILLCMWRDYSAKPSSIPWTGYATTSFGHLPVNGLEWQLKIEFLSIDFYEYITLFFHLSGMVVAYARGFGREV